MKILWLIGYTILVVWLVHDITLLQIAKEESHWQYSGPGNASGQDMACKDVHDFAQQVIIADILLHQWLRK